ncbi:hypothetical protein [Moorena sp. SIO4G3]|nr:hypothetical protein [Moorena sp. SIO4G3]NEO79021.1 hypothetical protein [Moorena sp. SIO4G3]
MRYTIFFSVPCSLFPVPCSLFPKTLRCAFRWRIKFATGRTSKFCTSPN